MPADYRNTEVEYGISSPSDPTAKPDPHLRRRRCWHYGRRRRPFSVPNATRWDYEVESPLRDARGFDLSRSAGPPPVVRRRRGRRGQHDPDQRARLSCRPRAP
ncbi:proteasome accessory factor PafA2 family protein, partial [Mycobacterium tuberculosis]|uniref:proteasome accessory factor PafA2 family protein n=1 Tax=Mycobacterium tuberculosis TaxID=1773 RepID=UPI003C6DBBE5